MNKHFSRDVEKLTALLSEQLGRVKNNARVVLLSEGGGGTGFIPDKVLDQTEVVLEEECLKISALHQPVASDLRFLTVVIKANRDLERIGDLMENIKDFQLDHAKIHADLGDTDGYLMPLFAQVEMAVSDACACLRNQDDALATKIWAHNKEIDNICDRMMEKMRGVLMEKAASKDLLDALLSVRYAKRAADHAANIAKEVLYLV
ncbi:MAG: PhoU domain-containing protein, partial [Kiritimatiellia bacterium]